MIFLPLVQVERKPLSKDVFSANFGEGIVLYCSKPSSLKERVSDFIASNSTRLGHQFLLFLSSCLLNSWQITWLQVKALNPDRCPKVITCLTRIQNRRKRAWGKEAVGNNKMPPFEFYLVGFLFDAIKNDLESSRMFQVNLSDAWSTTATAKSTCGILVGKQENRSEKH